MNQVSINLKKGECIDFIDKENISKDQLEDKLSSLFSINNVAILKTESTSVILRPSDISSIRIEEIIERTSAPIPIEKPLPKKDPQVSIDIIKDVS